MRFTFFIVLVVVAFSSCTENASVTNAKVDSTINKIDSTAKAVFDSTKEQVKSMKKNLDSTFDKK